MTLTNQRQQVQLFLVSVPDQEFNWTITLDGQLHVTWLRKFSSYQEDNPVDISWISSSSSSSDRRKSRLDESVSMDQGSRNGSARLVTIPALTLGHQYTATLMDLKDEDNLATFTFTACEYNQTIDWERGKDYIFFYNLSLKIKLIELYVF